MYVHVHTCVGVRAHGFLSKPLALLLGLGWLGMAWHVSRVFALI